MIEFVFVRLRKLCAAVQLRRVHFPARRYTLIGTSKAHFGLELSDLCKCWHMFVLEIRLRHDRRNYIMHDGKAKLFSAEFFFFFFFLLFRRIDSGAMRRCSHIIRAKKKPYGSLDRWAERWVSLELFSRFSFSFVSLLLPR